MVENLETRCLETSPVDFGMKIQLPSKTTNCVVGGAPI